MVQLSTTYFLIMAVAVAAIVVTAAAAATDADPEADSDVEADPTNPPVTENPRCKHPLFCRQRPPMFGQRLRPSILTTTPSTTTTTRRSTNRFNSRPNLFRADGPPHVKNTLQQSTRSRFPSRTTEAPKEETKDLQTAEIEDLSGSEKPSLPRAGNSGEVTTSTPIASTSRNQLPLTMARYRTNASKTSPKTLAPTLDPEDAEKSTVPTTVPPIADCPDGVCTTIKRVPGATVVVRKKKIRPGSASHSHFQGTTESYPVTEVPQEDTAVRQTLPLVESSTRRPFASHRVPGLYKSKVSQKAREQTNISTPKTAAGVTNEVTTHSVTESVTIRQPNIYKPKHRKKLTTTTELPDNTEYPTTQSWREDVSYEEVPAKGGLRSNKKCGKSCRGNFKRPTTTPEPENYPTNFPLRPLKQRNEKSLDSVDQTKAVYFNTNSPKEVYKTETENPRVTLQNTFTSVSPPAIDEPSVSVQYLKEIVPTADDEDAALLKQTYTATKEVVKPKSSLPVQTKTRIGKNSGEEQNIKYTDTFNQLQPYNKFPYSQSPKTTPGIKDTNFSGYNYPATTKRPSQQNTKKPAFEAPKSMGAYFYSRPTTPLALPTTARPKLQTTPMPGLNYMYPKPQMPFLYPTTMKPIMQESTSFLPMLLQKKKEVLENTPIIGPAMTTVRNIINFITKPEEMFAKNYEQLKYQSPYQYSTTYTPMISQTTYSPYMNFPPYPPRNTFQKQTASVDSGFKLKAKPRKKGLDDNRTEKIPHGFDALTMRPISSPRPFNKHTDEPYRFESTSSQYDTTSSSTLKADATFRHHYYSSPTRGRHVGRGNSSGRKTRTRPRKRCQNMRCRSSRQNTFRSEDASIYVPVSFIMKVRKQKVRTKRQNSEGEGYIYPRPTLRPTSASVSTENVDLTPKITASSSSTSLTSGTSASTKPGSSTSVIPGTSDNNEPFTGYEYSRPQGSSTLPTLTSTASSGPTSTTLRSPIPAASGSSNGSEETFEGYDYSKPLGGATFTSNPNTMATSGSKTSEESFEGYDYSKPAKPFLPGPGSSALPETGEGYDYPKPSKRLST